MVGPLRRRFMPAATRSWRRSPSRATRRARPSGTLVVSPASQGVIFAPLSDRTFGDPPFTVGATASSGLPVSFSAAGACTVAGTTVTITGAGSCTVTASQAGNTDYSPAPDVPRGFVTAKAAATLLLGDLSQMYDGTPRASTFTTTPTDLSGVTVTYDGSPAPPTNAGSYAVLAVLVHPDYQAPDVAGTLVIAKASQTITFDPLSDRNLGDPPFPVVATASSNLAVAFEVTGPCTVLGTSVTLSDIGLCTIQASQTGDGNYEPATPSTRTFLVIGTSLPGTWSPVASMMTGRWAHTATRLLDGRVLIVGGSTGTVRLATAEIYDVVDETWAATPPFQNARYGHQAVLLRDGRVLIVGGTDDTGVLASVQIYDPASNAWGATAPMAEGRYVPTATLLSDGRVLVAGGATASGRTDSTEIYDPASGTWAAGPTMNAQRYVHAAVALLDGRVLVVGGLSPTTVHASAEIYDPAAGVWTSVASMATAREFPVATRLLDGRVLVTGGRNTSGQYVSSAEIYDPTTDTWTSTAPMGSARYDHAAVLLPDGLVLVAGGIFQSGLLASSQLYNWRTNTWTAGPSMGTGRRAFTATALTSHRILVAGGGTLSSFSNPGPAQAGVQVYGKTPQTITFAELPDRTLGDPPFSVEATSIVRPCRGLRRGRTLLRHGRSGDSDRSRELHDYRAPIRECGVCAGSDRPADLRDPRAPDGLEGWHGNGYGEQRAPWRQLRCGLRRGVRRGHGCIADGGSGCRLALWRLGRSVQRHRGLHRHDDRCAERDGHIRPERPGSPRDRRRRVAAGRRWPGTSFSMTDTTRNQGGLAAPNSRTNYVLSLDATRDGADVIVGGRGVGALGAGISSSGR